MSVVRVLVIGTSITEGVVTFAPKPGEAPPVLPITSWTTYAQDEAARDGKAYAFFNRGQSGRRIKDVTRMLPDLLGQQYDIFFLEIGANDCAVSNPVSASDWYISLEEIVRMSVWNGWGTKWIVVPQVPLFARQAEWIGPRDSALARSYNAAINLITDAMGGRVRTTSTAMDLWDSDVFVCDDFVHPSPLGQRELARRWYGYIRKLR